MNKKRPFLLLVSLLILSLACNLPFIGSGGDAIPEDELSGALNLMSGYDTYFGVMETFDINEYGFPNVLYYTLPEEEIAEGIYMQQLYSMENRDSNGYRAGTTYFLRNDTDADAYVEVVIDVPKEIAPTFDDMTLSQAPLEIIEPDPKGRFGFHLKAKSPPQVNLAVISNIISVPAGYDPDKAFMDMVLASSANDLCKRVFADDEKLNKEMQDMCYFNVVRDFKDHVEAGSLAWSCASIKDKDLANTCAALLQTDRRFCDEIKDRVNKERCLAQLVNDACLEVPIEERELCIAEGALEMNSFGACLEVGEPDIKNDCIARVMSSQKYCDRIVDDDLRGQCYYNIGIREADEDSLAETEAAEETEEPENTEEPEKMEESEETGIDQFSGGGIFSGDMFSSKKAKAYCNSFTSLTGVYPVIKTIGAGDVLTCVYGDEKDRESDAYTYKMMLSVWQYPSEEEAASKWAEVNGTDAVWLDLVLYKSLLIKQDHTDTAYYYQERHQFKADGKDVTEYRLYAGQLVGRYRIEYTEFRQHDEGSDRWNTTLQQIMDLISE